MYMSIRVYPDRENPRSRPGHLRVPPEGPLIPALTQAHPEGHIPVRGEAFRMYLFSEALP